MKDKAIGKTELAEKLRELRKSMGLTQKQAAEAIGIEYQNYRKYETTTLPREDAYIKIADFFGVTIDYLMGRTNKKFGEEKKVITTYSEKNNKSFIINQNQTKLKVVKNMDELTDLEALFIKKLRELSIEDKNDVIQYLNNKKSK